MATAAPAIAEIRAKTILTPAAGYVAGGYTHTLNPYQGCGFGADLPDGPDTAAGEDDHAGRGDRGCPYCYVRRMPVGLYGPGPWGSWVSAKVNAPELLREEGRRGRLALARIFLGSATDPYQFVAENRYRLTRRVIETFLDYPPAHVTLQTRSPLVERDFDLLVRLGAGPAGPPRDAGGFAGAPASGPSAGGDPRVRLSVTIETDDESVRRAVTPTTPPAARRLETLRRARALGLSTQAAISPVLPCDPERFADLVAAVADRVYLDSLWIGDGARGARSAALGMPRRLRAIGRGDWVSRDAHLPLYRALVARMGPARVRAACGGGERPPASRPAPAQGDLFTLDPRFAPRRGSGH